MILQCPHMGKAYQLSSYSYGIVMEFDTTINTFHL